MACVLHLPHRPTIFSLSILLFFLRNKPSLLCLLRLTSGDSHLFFSTLREHQRTFFPAVFATFSSVSLTFHLSPCLCRATLLPSVHRLFLAASLNISIWPCQLHFHLHFLQPPPHLQPSPIIFIYAKVAADAAPSVSSEVYVPLSRPFFIPELRRRFMEKTDIPHVCSKDERGNFPYSICEDATVYTPVQRINIYKIYSDDITYEQA